MVQEADEGWFRAENPAIPGFATQGEALEDLLENRIKRATHSVCGRPQGILGRGLRGGPGRLSRAERPSLARGIKPPGAVAP